MTKTTAIYINMSKNAVYIYLAQDHQKLACVFTLDKEIIRFRATIKQLNWISFEKHAHMKRGHYMETDLDDWTDE